MYAHAEKNILNSAHASACKPRLRISRGRSLKMLENWLFTSNWNCVNSFTNGFLDWNIVGVAPLLLSAMMFAAKRSASRSASSSSIPRRRFWLYRARTIVSAVNMSIHSMGIDSFALQFPCHVRTSGSLPRRFVRNALRSQKPSSFFIAASVCPIARTMSPVDT